MSESVFIGATLLDRYEVVERLGGGGMADVYRAIDHRMDDDSVAIKVPKEELLVTPALKRKFEKEIKQQIRLRHLPGVVHIYDQGEHEGMPFFVMAYLGGGALEDRLGSNLQTPEEVCAWLLPVAEALDAVAKIGVVHRDVKPANILFDADGRPMLSDFGIVKALSGTTAGMTATQLKMFTPGYASPEQIVEGAGADTIDGRADQYALGCTVFAALAGRTPFKTANLKLMKPAPSVRELVGTVPMACADAIGKTLKRDPDERFENCTAFAKAFEAGLVKASPPKRKKPAKTARTTAAVGPEAKPRSRVVFALLLGAVIAAGIYVGYGYLFAHQEPKGEPVTVSDEGPATEPDPEPQTEPDPEPGPDPIPPAPPPDTTTPVITITSPEDLVQTVDRPELVIVGTVVDEHLASFLVDDVEQIETLQDGARFTIRRTLEEGKATTIQIVAVDEAGNRATAGRTATYVRPAKPWEAPLAEAIAEGETEDWYAARKHLKAAVSAGAPLVALPAWLERGIETWEALPPALTINSPASSDLVEGLSLTVTGTLDTPRPSDQLTVGGKVAAVEDGKFSVELAFEAYGPVSIECVVRDIEVNEQRIARAVNVTLEPPLPAWVHGSSVVVARVPGQETTTVAWERVTRIAKVDSDGKVVLATPVDKPLLIYVRNEKDDSDSEKIELIVFPDHKVSLGLQAFRTLRMTPEDANLDPLLSGDYKRDVPRLVFVTPAALLPGDGGDHVYALTRVKVSSLYGALKKYANRVYDKSLDREVKRHLKDLSEVTKLANALRMSEEKWTRKGKLTSSDERRLRKLRDELADVARDMRDRFPLPLKRPREASPAKASPELAWAKVSDEQKVAAERLGVPVAFENEIGMRFVLIPSGTFRMGRRPGAVATEDHKASDEQIHRVTLTKAYYLQITEVTNREYRRWRPEHVSAFKDVERDRIENAYEINGDEQPATCITHVEAMEFATWLTERADGATRYRLPTEAEWEHAARAGTDTIYFWGDDGAGARPYGGDEIDPSSGSFSQGNVGSYRPSPWGIYDQVASVNEMCSDWFAPFRPGSSIDPMGPATGAVRVTKGACSHSREYRHARRDGQKPPGHGCLGFRLVASLPTPAARQRAAWELPLAAFRGAAEQENWPEARKQLDAAIKAGVPESQIPSELRKRLEDWEANQGVPSWAMVNDEQKREARRLGVPVAWENDLGMRFVLIPPGTFMMGATDEEIEDIIEAEPSQQRDWYRQEFPRHEVQITRAFYLQTTEVSNAQFRHWKSGHDSGTSHSQSLNRDEQPAVHVSHHDIAGTKGDGDGDCFLDWLNNRFEPGTPDRMAYRLPSEAEWEYACRAGSSKPFFWGESHEIGHRYANAGWSQGFPEDDGHAVSAPVASYLPNGFGIYDMLGNVWEWVADWYDPSYYKSSPKADPRVATPGTETPVRALRGGSWRASWYVLRSSNRASAKPAERSLPLSEGTLGFRLAVTIEHPRKKVTLAHAAADLGLTAEEQESVRRITRETMSAVYELLADGSTSADDVRRELEEARQDESKRPAAAAKYFPLIIEKLGEMIPLRLEHQKKLEEAIGKEKVDRLESAYEITDLGDLNWLASLGASK